MHGTYYSVTGERIHLGHPEPESTPLEESIERASRWASEQAFIGSGIGERNTHTIYNEVVKVILESPPGGSEESMPSQLNLLKKTLEELSSRSREYAKFGLAPPLPIRELLQALSNPDGIAAEKTRIIYNVLRPYAEGIEARLAAPQ